MLGRPPEGSEGEATSYGAVAMLQPGHTASGPGQSLEVLQQPHCPLSRVQSWQVSMSKHPRTEQPGLVFWQMTWIAELSSCSEGTSPVFSLHLTWNRVSLVSPIPKLTFDTCQLDLPAGPFVCWQ